MLQRRIAFAQEVDVVVTPDKAHVRHAVDKGFWIFQDVIFNLIRPELTRDFKRLVHHHGFADINAAVFFFWGVVHFGEGGVAGTGVIPAVGAFFRYAIHAFIHVDGPVWLQLMQVSPQSGAHDAPADQNHINGLILFCCCLLRDAKQVQTENKDEYFSH
ncbi:hypothetical protein D3C78_1079580 [compost metagenome]